MSRQKKQQKKFDTWDSAFRALVPEIRQQSVRVAAYTQVLFAQACASSFEKNNTMWPDRILEKYVEHSYKCGLYHQLGKCLLEPELQLWHNEFLDAEKAAYRKYPSKGRLMIANLQQKAKDADNEKATRNIPWLMIREAHEQHMERWDGSGYPNGLVGNEISPIAQIVGIAKELDRLASEIKSENPFNEAYAALIGQEGKAFSPQLIEVLKASKGKCRSVYRKYIQYTKTIPKTIPLVDKRADRPMGLQYRYVSKRESTQGILYEAIPWFGGVLGKPEVSETLQRVEPILERTKTLNEVMIYFLYEVADTILRAQNCELNLEGILMPMPAAFFSGDSLRVKLDQLLLDQPIDAGKLLLLIPEKVVMEADKLVKDVLADYIEHGYQLVLDDYHPDYITLDLIQEIGFTKVRVSTEIQEDLEYLQSRGIDVIGRPSSEELFVEEELIQAMLMGER